MKNALFSPHIGTRSFSEAAWGKGVVFFVAIMIMWNAAVAGQSLTPEKQEILHKIVLAQSTLLQFFSFSSLPIMAVDNLLKRSGLGDAAPKRPTDESQSSNAQCDRCIVRPAVENNRHILKILFHFVVPSAACVVVGRLFSSIHCERWRDSWQSLAGIRPYFFLLPRSSVNEEGVVAVYGTIITRPDFVRPGISISYGLSECRGGL